MIGFRVYGKPVPKQSFKMGKNGGYTPAHVKAWQELIASAARMAMLGRDPLGGNLSVSMIFFLPDKKRRDLDNLSKAVCDGMNKIVYNDDQQIVELCIQKRFGNIDPGVDVEVADGRRTNQ